MMDRKRFEEIDRILDRMIDLTAEERAREIAAIADDELRHEVERVARELDQEDDFIEAPFFAGAKSIVSDDESESLQIGSYRLKRVIGRGGMSTVYLAARTDDYEKDVAIKIVPRFEHRPAASENFRRERQILARLSDPAIAQILDGGTANDGRPFIVMEFVDGVPLDEYCRSMSLGLNERLELFLEVCRAVSVAHQNLIVHRDLKPNNILIDRLGRVKLLDFGIAKLLDPESGGFASANTFEGTALTFEYAAPEQISNGDISVATDVYGLGVVLFELVFEHRPFQLDGESLATIAATIRERRPEFENPTGDLELVIGKALAKSPSERYQSVDAFAADIRNFIDSAPVSVAPATVGYRLGKYLRRHRTEALIAALFLIVLFGWLGTAIYQARQAKAQAELNRRAAYSAEMILAAGEYESANLNRLKEIVEKYVPEPGTIDLRGFEWQILNRWLNPTSKIVEFKHPDEIWATSFSPDGTRVVTVSNDNRARVWNPADGTFVETAEQAGAWEAAFFPDGSRFAVAGSSNSDPTVRIYDSATAAEIRTIRNHTKRIRALDVSPNGKIIATGSQDGSVVVQDENGRIIKTFSFLEPNRGTEIYAVAFDAEGTRLAVAGFDRLSIIDTKTWERRSFDSESLTDRDITLNPWCIAFSPLGKTIALGMFDGTILFVDADSLQLLRTLKIHQSNVKSVAFSKDGRTLASASWDRTVKFTDIASGNVLNELRGHFSGVHDLAFSPDGRRIATVGGDFNLCIWDSAAAIGGGALLTGANLSTYDRRTGRLFTHDNQTGSVSVWSVTERRKLHSFETTVRAFSIDVSPDGTRVAIGDCCGKVLVFDAENGALQAEFDASDRAIHAVRFGTGSATLAAAYEDGFIRLFDLDRRTEIFRSQAHQSLIKGMDLTPDGFFAISGSNDNRIVVTDLRTGATVREFGGFSKPLYRTILSADGELIAATGANDFVELRTIDGALKHRFSGTSGGVFAAAFSPDGSRLATASDVNLIRLWNTRTGEQVLAFNGSDRQIINLAFTNDGQTLISIDVDGKVRFWNG